MNRCICIISLLSFLAVNLRAQDIKFDRLAVSDGLSNSNVTAIIQDHQQFMWFATHDGLNRYDGYEFRHFYNDPDDSTSLSYNSIRDLLVDNKGRLWVATEGGLDLYESESETFRRFHHFPGDRTTISSPVVTELFQDKTGTIWIGTTGGLNWINPESLVISRFESESDAGEMLVEGNIREIVEAESGELWVGTRDGLFRLNKDSGDVVPVSIASGLQRPLLDNDIDSIHEDSEGNIWIGTCRGNLYKFSTEDYSPQQMSIGLGSNVYPPEESKTVYNRCTSVSIIHEDQSGRLWIGKYNAGLHLYEKTQEEPLVIEHDLRNSRSLSDNAIVSIYEDLQGRIWIGTWHAGVNKFDPYESYFEYRQPVSFKDQVVKDKTVWSLYEDDYGNLIAGTLRGGISQLASGIKEPEALKMLLSKEEFSNSWVISINQTRNGDYWVSSSEKGMLKIKPSGEIEHVDDYPGGIYETDDFIWMSSRGKGLTKIEKGSGKKETFRADPQQEGTLSTNGVAAIYEDNSNRTWISSNNGLNLYIPETNQFRTFLRGKTIWSNISEDKEGKLWLGSPTEGLFHFDPSTGEYQNYTTKDGLPSNAITCTLIDRLGKLWIGTTSKLTRLDPATGAFRTFEVGAELGQNGFVWWGCLRTISGEFVFGGYEGYLSFDPNEIIDNPNPPALVITDFRVDEESVQHAGEKLSLQYNRNDISIEYVGIEYTAPDRVQYRYKLANYDGGWVNAGTSRSVRYNKLPPGEYIFHVTAANGDGVWNEKGASLAITISPPWWYTSWAYTFYGLILVCGVIGVDRYQRRRLERKAKEKENARNLEHAKEIKQAHSELQSAHEHLKATQQQLIQQEKLASLGQLTSGIAHEIKNPLNFVNNFALLNHDLVSELKEKVNTDEEIEEILSDLESNSRQIAKHGGRADQIVRSMMQHASNSEGNRYLVDVNALVEEYAKLSYSSLQSDLMDEEIRLEMAFSEGTGSLKLAPQDIGRVLQNLLINSFESVLEKHNTLIEGYEPEVKISTVRENGQVIIRIADNGSGIPPEIKDKIFEPFFTTKPTGSGTGLGLSISYDIVTQGHGGNLSVESEEGNGATFTISLPV